MKKIFIISMLAILVIIGVGIILSKKVTTPVNTNSTIGTPEQLSQNNQPPPDGPVLVPKSDLAEPVADFKARVTKKPFGIYITPKNSPISPERFTGYHTGADAEHQDVTADVPVYAVADGIVVLSEVASGYGGVFIIEISLSGTKHTVLYGHIRPGSLPKVGQKVIKGEQISMLGTSYSSETDGERRHLHFSIRTDNSLNIKGYVSTKAQLTSWLDPLNYY